MQAHATPANVETPEPLRAIPLYERSAFVRTIYWSTLGASVAGAGACLFAGAAASVSYLLGASVAFFSFWSLEQMLKWLYQTRRRSKRYLPVLLALGKYGVLGVVLYGMIRWEWARIGYFALGICMIFFGTVFSLIFGMIHSRPVATGRQP